MEQKVWDVIIIGSGPSGLTAAIYTSRGAASTLVLGGERWGGQLMLTSLVENYPGFPDGILGPSLMENMKNQAVRFGSNFVTKNVTEVDFTKKPFILSTSDEKFKARSVIITTGALTKWLEVENEVGLIGKGISSCASCDAAFFKDKIVAVVGGGDTAMEDASTLTKFASKVYIIHRRNDFKASPIMQKKVTENPKVEILWNTQVTKIIGKDKVQGVTIKDNKTNKENNLKLDGVFVAIGHKPDSDIFKGKVEMDEKGYIIHKGFHLSTSVPGVFVAGDVFDKEYKQAVVSAGLGCVAALEALKYLDENAS